MKARVIQSSVMARCPKRSMLPAHFRDDGSCRCDERPEADAAWLAAHAAVPVAEKRAARIVEQAKEAERAARQRRAEC